LWLLLQAAQVAALVPADCCAAHRLPAEPKPAAAQCPMHANQAAVDVTDDTKDSDCAMRGTCGGPFAALLALLSNQSILTRPAATTPTFDARPMFTGRQENVAALFDPPNSPPPRA
jgi:hypothetical protein